MNEQLKEKLDKFIKDPEWNVIEDCLKDYINPLRNIDNINLDDSPEVVKAEVRVRKETYDRINSFLCDIGLLKPDKEGKTNPHPFK